MNQQLTHINQMFDNFAQQIQQLQAVVNQKDNLIVLGENTIAALQAEMQQKDAEIASLKAELAATRSLAAEDVQEEIDLHELSKRVGKVSDQIAAMLQPKQPAQAEVPPEPEAEPQTAEPIEDVLVQYIAKSISYRVAEELSKDVAEPDADTLIEVTETQTEQSNEDQSGEELPPEPEADKQPSKRYKPR